MMKRETLFSVVAAKRLSEIPEGNLFLPESPRVRINTRLFAHNCFMLGGVLSMVRSLTLRSKSLADFNTGLRRIEHFIPSSILPVTP